MKTYFWLGQRCLLLLLMVFAVACAAPAIDSRQAEDSASATAATAAQPATESTATTLRHAHSWPIGNLDPHRNQGNIQMLHFQLVYDGLVTEEADGTIVPALATEWVDTGTVLDFTLREGVLFHDGTPFDAAVVKANIERVQSGIYPPTANFLRAIATVEVIDPTHVRFNLTEPDPALLGYLARFAGLMISPNAFETAAQVPVGTGPWQYNAEATLPDAKYVYDRFENFWDPSQQGVDRIEIDLIPEQTTRINALLAGEYDSVAIQGRAGTASLEAEGIRLLSGESAHLGLHIFDRGGEVIPAFADERVRQALGHAIDNEVLFQTIDYGTANDQRYFPGQVGHCETFAGLPYDPAKARALLAEAGVEQLEFTVPSSPGFRSYDEALAGFLAEVGVTMKIESIPPTGIFAEPASGNWVAGIVPINEVHPVTFINNRVADGFLNPQKVVDEDIAELRTLAQSASGEEAEALWAEILCKFYARGYILHIGVFNQSVAVQSYVNGVEQGRYFMPATYQMRGVTLGDR